MKTTGWVWANKLAGGCSSAWHERRLNGFQLRLCSPLISWSARLTPHLTPQTHMYTRTHTHRPDPPPPPRTSMGKKLSAAAAGTTNSADPVRLVSSISSMLHTRQLLRMSYRQSPSICIAWVGEGRKRREGGGLLGGGAGWQGCNPPDENLRSNSCKLFSGTRRRGVQTASWDQHSAAAGTEGQPARWKGSQAAGAGEKRAPG